MIKAQNLVNYLASKNCLKIICGANNENYDEIKKIVALYSSAGCKFFDINASKEAILAAIEGLKYSNCYDSEHFICVSVGTKDDVHFKKCKINIDLCKKCGICQKICPQNAIEDLKIDEKKCIGCLKCKNACPVGAVSDFCIEKDFDDYFDLFPLVDCVEYHISTPNPDEIMQKWHKLIENYKGLISICINRSIFDEKTTLDLIKKMIDICPNSMIQADGKPMSGNNNEYNTTLQALAFADLILKSKINCPVFLSGGTNLKTKELLKLFSIDAAGISIGSYARKIVKDYINLDDFLQNKNKFNEALVIAKEFVLSVTS